MFYVYLLRSKKDENLYIGYTADLRKRVEEHNSGKNRSTKGRAPFELIYYEAYSSREDATKREQNLKLFARSYEGLKRRIPKSLKS